MSQPDWANLLEQCRRIIAGEPARQAIQAICALLRQSVGHYDWVGFYIADEGQAFLELGPYDGEPTEHTRIAFGRGICGQAAATKDIFVVQDVSKEANYLSCGVNVKSEIVLPILGGYDGGRGEDCGQGQETRRGGSQTVLAELDIDSNTPNAFGPRDRKFLKKVCQLVKPALRTLCQTGERGQREKAETSSIRNPHSAIRNKKGVAP